ncbi:hypothetical protein M408DRAFT_318915 [Serendipita vermifera MAFF 305830]|uniref:Uncharacterized protein n=1 Tax=Serendipita vermifera MAFF 305830 TaxID=933852 RepID=A0A0C2X408_SERVB|nr:hypothetical protein M408DRAFT_318915 [Serendipita vermifera MAFF 305830]
MFSIGSFITPPLVNFTEVQAHLKLLSAFNKLKDDIQRAAVGASGPDQNEPGLDPERAWVVFVNQAAHRFDKFMSGKLTGEFPRWSEETIPPLDVIMVWHTYLLNPRTYYDDSIRRTTPFARRLAAMETMPLSLIASLIDPVTFEPAVPSYQRESYFETTSGLPFLYSQEITTNGVVSLTCPCCNALNSTVPWITTEGKGFGEPNFEHTCEECSRKFTRSMMGVRKFCEEFTRLRAGRRVYFAETLLDPMTGKQDTMLADMMTLRLVRRIHAVFKIPKGCDQDNIVPESMGLAKALDWNTQELSLYIHQGLRPRKKVHNFDAPLPRVQRLVSAYSNAGYASIDLVAAVLRQGSFIKKMKDLGWLESKYCESSNAPASLFRAIVRYHAFLDLMTVKDNSFLVPTLGIDLVWHTHQLSGASYRSETLRLLKRTPNHDDTVQPVTLQGGFDSTAAAWKQRFGVPYSICGCMPDDVTPPKSKSIIPSKGSKSSGEKKAGSKFGFFKRQKAPAGQAYSDGSTIRSEVTVSHTPRNELVVEEPNEMDTTHPSEHNLCLQKIPIRLTFATKDSEPVVTVGGVEADFVARELASKERVTSIKQGLESTNAEPVDSWRKLQAERKSTRTDHREAFTTPDQLAGVYHPYWGLNAAVPFGFYGAFKYPDAVGGCSNGCASCGAAPGLFEFPEV